MKKEIMNVTKQFSNYVGKNSPTILTGLAVGGLITTTVMAVKATPKALDLLDQAENEKWDSDPDNFTDLTKQEQVKAVWKCYIPAAVMGGATVACIIGANKINQRRLAALAGLYSLTETTLKEYQKKVVETIGEESAKKIKDEISQDKINANPSSNNQIFVTGNGKVKCYDEWSGRYFDSSVDEMNRVQNELNRDLLLDWVSLNDVYYALGQKPIRGGEEVGWAMGELVEFSFSGQLTAEGEPCIAVYFLVGPRYDTNKLG